MTDEQPTSKSTSKAIWVALGYLVLVLAISLGLLIGYGPDWFGNRVSGDFWPFDNSHVAPNILASVIQYTFLAIVAVLVYPPIRRAVGRFVQGHVDSIKAHVSSEHAKAKEERDALHEKVNTLLESHNSLHEKVNALMGGDDSKDAGS